MKQLALAILLTFVSGALLAQPDLVIANTDFAPDPVSVGGMFTVDITVSNVGNATAAENYLMIYYTPDFSVDDEERVSRVSVQELGPGESQEVQFRYPITASFLPGAYYLAMTVDYYDEVAETDEQNSFCASNETECITFTVDESGSLYRKLPYPIIFVHGLVGDDTTWDEFTEETAPYYGWFYGGRLNYCLNPDDNVFTADAFISSFTEAAELGVGDYYLVNFDVSPEGALYVLQTVNDAQSNQSAIVKQGWAMQDAVAKVLSVTGAEKVILVGHSMGGLACREYLQNLENWQSDGDHHVAKLLTVGSPNGGSNVSGAGIGGIFLGIDEASEAVRDLRYPNLFFTGKYLFGGIEDNTGIYYNKDINCNGFLGDAITGLNEKLSPVDINYACIVGVDHPFGGDAVVAEDRADLNNYLFADPPLLLHADRFDVVSFHNDLHKENHSTMIQGLDEPLFYELAYPIQTDRLLFGHSTIQAENSPLSPPDNQVDWDTYRLDFAEAGLLELELWNVPVHTFGAFIVDENYDTLAGAQSSGASNLLVSAEVEPGTYYLDMGSIPTTNIWRFPYAFEARFTPSIPLVANFTATTTEGCAPFTVNFENLSTGNNPSYLWGFPGGQPSTSVAANPTVVYEESGVYPVSLTISDGQGSDALELEGFITVKAAPEAAFTLTIQQDTVSLTNTTTYGIDAPTYSWSFGDNTTSTSPSPTQIYGAEGAFTISLTATNSCGSSTATETVNIVIVGTDRPASLSGVHFFPNPTSGFLQVEWDGAYNGPVVARVLNKHGQLIRQYQWQKSANIFRATLDLEAIPAGAYQVLLKTGDEQGSWWVVKN